MEWSTASGRINRGCSDEARYSCRNHFSQLDNVRRRSAGRTRVADQQRGRAALALDTDRCEDFGEEPAEAGFPIPLEDQTRQRSKAAQLPGAAGHSGPPHRLQRIQVSRICWSKLRYAV